MLEVVIPAYNEEDRLPRTLRELRRYLLATPSVGAVEVVVVDNGSTDATTAVALAADAPGLPVRVVHCAERGKGAAVRAGLAASSAPVVAFMDADGATRLDAIDGALARLRAGADVVIGSRAVLGAETQARHSRLRDRGARVFRACAARIVPGVADTQCGFKVLRGDLARTLAADLRATGFSFDVELLARARAAGALVVEMPVWWVDVPGSTFDPARHGVDAFRELAAIAWRGRGGRFAPVPPVLPVPVAVPVAVAPAPAPLLPSLSLPPVLPSLAGGEA